MRYLRLLALALLGISLAGCLGARPVPWQDPATVLAWPEPPEKPRIRFLRAFSSLTDFRTDDRANRLFRWIAGENNEDLPLVMPYGISADGKGRIWVADSGARLVHAFDLARQKVEYFNGGEKEPFASPVGVAIDSEAERLYVSDSMRAEVFVLDYKGKQLETWVPPNSFGRPGGMATDSRGNLYVTDVLKGTIEIFSREGKHLKSLGAQEGKFNRPSNVWVDRLGRIFIADSMNFQVKVLAPDGEVLGVIGGLGDVPGTFARPRGVAVDSEGHVYVADAAFDNIQVFDFNGQLLLSFGGPGNRAGDFKLPAGLFVDASDRLYVVDAYNHRIQIFQYVQDGKQGRTSDGL